MEMVKGIIGPSGSVATAGNSRQWRLPRDTRTAPASAAPCVAGTRPSKSRGRFPPDPFEMHADKYARQDSNLQPSVPKTDALSIELRTRDSGVQYTR